jgi:hypothetical protein
MTLNLVEGVFDRRLRSVTMPEGRSANRTRLRTRRSAESTWTKLKRMPGEVMDQKIGENEFENFKCQSKEDLS